MHTFYDDYQVPIIEWPNWDFPPGTADCKDLSDPYMRYSERFRTKLRSGTPLMAFMVKIGRNVFAGNVCRLRILALMSLNFF